MLQPSSKDWTVDMSKKHINMHGPNVLDPFLTGMQGAYSNGQRDEIPGFNITAAVAKRRESNLTRANIERQKGEDAQCSHSTHSTGHISPKGSLKGLLPQHQTMSL